MNNFDILLEKVIQTHFLKLDFDVDINNILKEYKSIEKKYPFESYKTKYWGVKKKYARSWSGISLVSFMFQWLKPTFHILMLLSKIFV